MWIVPCDLFLIKKLLKNGVCWSREQCTGVLFTRKKPTTTAEKKKEKKEKASVKHRRQWVGSKRAIMHRSEPLKPQTHSTKPGFKLKTKPNSSYTG